jgi:hypothetical protein
MNELIYIAVPFSHKDKKVRDERFEKVTVFAGKLMSEGKYVFSPITHCYPIALRHSLPETWDYWQGYCELMVPKCNRLIVLKLEGWEDSEGVTAEIKLAEALGIPIEYVEEKDLNLTTKEK